VYARFEHTALPLRVYSSIIVNLFVRLGVAWCWRRHLRSPLSIMLAVSPLSAESFGSLYTACLMAHVQTNHSKTSFWYVFFFVQQNQQRSVTSTYYITPLHVGQGWWSGSAAPCLPLCSKGSMQQAVQNNTNTTAGGAGSSPVSPVPRSRISLPQPHRP